ncbi:hypothetical protein LTR78_000510 [Recurvomyces mirabilis]|uniref:Increased recombination centers protein 6 n=1 Tax=Recurvomyces mirabilis TaxID=574656 RepID=A0AAE1C6P3_9PEZI|nr:hypothetical protein LTR78_000510 [Recurvomyces mirabilis]KAK5162165.1 hypothetical protein LTS14_000511 [Recurvomyces mirabilis]
MDIKHTRRILAVGAPNGPVLDVVKDLTGSTPQVDDSGSAAGSVHEWAIKTAYYSATVPIWIDEIVDADEWKSEFLKPEAKEVVEAIGGYIFAFRLPADGSVSKEAETMMEAIQTINEEHIGYSADNVMLAVALPPLGKDNVVVKLDDWEDICIAYGFEFVNYAVRGRNDHGERVGLERLKEALEANEWAAADDEDGELDLDDLDFDAGDDSGTGFGRDEAEMTAELFGMKAALSGADDFEPEAEDFPRANQENQVEALNRMMGKLLAVKEQSAELPVAQRKRMAAQAIRDLFKEDAQA